MKTRRFIIIALSSIAFFAIGCQKNKLEDAAPLIDTERRLDVAKEEVNEAGRAINDYAYSQKNEYLNEMKAELKKLKQDFADLENQVKRTNDIAKVEAAKDFQTVKNEVSKLDMQIDIIQNATEDKWDEVKIKFNQSIDKVKSAIEKRRKWLSEKIAPIDY